MKDKTYYAIESFVNGSPVGRREVATASEARILARLIYLDLCKPAFRGSVRVIAYAVINASPQDVLLTVDEEND